MDRMGQAAAITAPEAVLTKAALRAAKRLKMTNRELAVVLGVSDPAVLEAAVEDDLGLGVVGERPLERLVEIHAGSRDHDEHRSAELPLRGGRAVVVTTGQRSRRERLGDPGRSGDFPKACEAGALGDVAARIAGPVRRPAALGDLADGVDVISFSVGTAAAFDDPVDIAFLGAFDAGVIVARSAGNEGPGVSTSNAGEPWNITVAASTQRGTSYAQATRVNAPASVAGDYPSLEGAITQPLVDSGDVTGDVELAFPQRACEPIAPVSGIVLILRGICDFSVKITNAVNAGATGVIVFTDDRPKTIMGGASTPETLSIPGVMVDREVGLALRTEINNGATVNATLSPTTFLPESMESRPSDGPTVRSSTIDTGAGKAPARSTMARSLASTSVPMPVMRPSPLGILLCTAGAERTLRSSTMAM